MSAPIFLRGMTWNHPRGYAPMAATAERFAQLHPDIVVRWEQRSLKAFEDYPVTRLAPEFDLIVLDHPCIPQVAPTGALLALDSHLPPAFLADQARHTVGGSHASYQYNGHQWALAIDAATPVAFWRPDLAERHGVAIPRTWEETLALARKGHVEIPGAPINCLMNFYSFCVAGGDEPFRGNTQVADRRAALFALDRLRELLALCAPEALLRNPIASHELVAGAANEHLVYCPLAYGYSNYAREGFAAHRLVFGEPPTLLDQPLRTTLGGTGLAISAHTKHVAAAVAYAEFVASPEIQRTLYTTSGGQPGHRTAWFDDRANRETDHYFARTLPALDRAFARPQFPGYMHFQEKGSLIVHAALRGEIADATALDQLDALYRETRSASTAPSA